MEEELEEQVKDVWIKSFKGVNVIHLNDKKSKGTHWVSFLIDRNTAVYFHIFGIEYIPQEVLNKIRDKSINHNIFRILDDSIV